MSNIKKGRKIDPEEVFIDSGAWIALADEDDSYHKKAVAIYPSLLSSCKALITTNFVIAESYIIIKNELGHRFAIRFLESINGSPRIIKIYSDEQIEKEAEDILHSYTDQHFSYTDSVSFTVMKKRKIKNAFSFDKHFQTMGFIKIP